jgi:hypothetical protein
VFGPVDFCDLPEHRSEEVVENDLSVEGHHEVVHVGPRAEIAGLSHGGGPF